MAYYGFVYVMSNPIMPDVYKIGYTDKSPRQRADDLSNTSVPTPYEVVAHWEVESPMVHEKQLHNLLSEKRISNNREFFKLNYDDFLDVYLYMSDFALSDNFNYPIDSVIEGYYIKQNLLLKKADNNETDS